MTMEDTHSHAETEATPEPEGPPQLPTAANNIWQDDASLSSLPPMPSPLEYSASTPMGGMLLMSSSDDRSLFSDKSLEDRLHRTLNHNVASSENQHSSFKMDLEPTLEVARLVQQVATLRETNQELRHENKLLITGGQSLEAQKEHLVEAKMTAELREREAQQETASLQQKLQEAHEQVAEKDHEILELKARLEKQSAEQERQESLQRSALEQAKEEANRKLDSLRRKNASLEQEKEDMAKVLEETQTLLEKATEECAARKVSMDTSTQNDSPAAQETKSVEKERPTKMAGRMNVDELEALVSGTLNRNTSPRASDSLPISERLCRIRDATERASLVKEHQREISRLMAAHEADKKQLLQKFEREKEIALENVMAEKDLEFKGLRRRMQSEHAKETEQAEQVHREEMQRVCEEADAAAASAIESLDVAMAQCEREIKRRKALEIRLDELQTEFDTQKKALAHKYASEVSKLGQGWEEERRNFIDTLQSECNSLFDRTKSASPRSVTTEFFADIELAEKEQTLSSLGGRPNTTETRSPTFAELDRTLRETEALVEKVLNNKGSDD